MIDEGNIHDDIDDDDTDDDGMDLGFIDGNGNLHSIGDNEKPMSKEEAEEAVKKMRPMLKHAKTLKRLQQEGFDVAALLIGSGMYKRVNDLWAKISDPVSNGVPSSKRATTIDEVSEMVKHVPHTILEMTGEELVIVHLLFTVGANFAKTMGHIYADMMDEDDTKGKDHKKSNPLGDDYNLDELMDRLVTPQDNNEQETN